MNLLYISSYQFRIEKGETYALPAYGNDFWEKYLDVFDNIHVLGEEIKPYIKDKSLIRITNPKISVTILDSITNPKDFFRDKEVRKSLEHYISYSEAIIIKPVSRKGIMGVKIAKRYKKPYMIEITGDLRLALKNSKNIMKKLYSPFLHFKVLKNIKDSPYGLYVTNKHLQEIYPIKGKTLGCTDTFIPYTEDEVLEKRIKKITTSYQQEKFDIGLIGFYHGKGKGLDTAIEALSNSIHKNIRLNVLGLGSQEDRNHWVRVAKIYDFEGKINFPIPLNGISKVMGWIDEQDVIILPSRSEGLPRSIIEAMSRACPTITSNVAGLPELVEKKWLHDPGNVLQLKILIDNLLGNKKMAVEMAKINFMKSKDYSYEKLRKKRNSFLNSFKQYCEKET